MFTFHKVLILVFIYVEWIRKSIGLVYLQVVILFVLSFTFAYAT